MKTSMLIGLIFLSTTTLNAHLAMAETSVKEKQEAALQAHINSTQNFFKNLPSSQQKDLTEVMNKLQKSEKTFIELIKGEGEPVLLVNGLRHMEDPIPAEWMKPLHKLIQLKQMSYFYKWDKHKSLEENSSELKVIIVNILNNHPEKNLKIVGYSAGGVITLLTMDSLVNDPIAKRIYFHTIASPLYGYGAPAIANIASRFAGKSSIQIGMGSDKKLIHKKLNNCTHWVTTNCELDKHSCTKKGINPQLGLVNLNTAPLPCGEENIKRIQNESHASVLNAVFDEIID